MTYSQNCLFVFANMIKIFLVNFFTQFPFIISQLPNISVKGFCLIKVSNVDSKKLLGNGTSSTFKTKVRFSQSQKKVMMQREQLIISKCAALLEGGSAVAQWLAHWPLKSGMGSLPVVWKFLCPNKLPFMSGMTGMTDDMNTVHSLSDPDVSWRPPVQGQSSPLQVKDPCTGSILMHVGSSCKHTVGTSVQGTPPRNNQKLINGSNKKQNKTKNLEIIN